MSLDTSYFGIEGKRHVVPRCRWLLVIELPCKDEVILNSKLRFSKDIVSTLHKSKILGLRAGTQPHRFIGVWFVVVKDRVFVRPWNNKPQGWYQAFMNEPVGLIQIANQEIPVRVRKSRGERLLNEIDAAYKEKYPTPGSRQYVIGFANEYRRTTTLELLPR